MVKGISDYRELAEKYGGKYTLNTVPAKTILKVLGWKCPDCPIVSNLSYSTIFSSRKSVKCEKCLIRRKVVKDNKNIKQCEYVFKQGQRKGKKCENKVQRDTGYCCAHNPKKEKKVKVEEVEDKKEESETESEVESESEEEEEVKEEKDEKSYELVLENGTKFRIPVREDGMISLTHMCKMGGKKYKHWCENKGTKEFLTYLQDTTGIPASSLIQVKKGMGLDAGTWGHPQVAIKLAQWISPEVGIKVEKWLKRGEITHNEALLEFQNGTKFKIPVREDGMINITKLAKAVNHRLDNYLASSETQAFIQALNKLPEFQGVKVLASYEGRNGGTWAHRLIAYNYAQKLSPEFAVQVSCWLDNLFLTGSVTLGKEKSQEELDSIWKDKCDQLLLENNQVKEEVKALVKSNKKLNTELAKYTKRHHYVKLGVNGPCYYIYSVSCTEAGCRGMKIKHGIAGMGGKSKLDERLYQHRTTDPHMELQLVIMSSEANIELLEKVMQEKHRLSLVAPNHEVFASQEELEKLMLSAINLIHNMCENRHEYGIAPRSDIEEYNENIKNTLNNTHFKISSKFCN